MKKIPKYAIALNLPQVVALLILFGRHVVQAMTGNPWFVSPSPPLSTVSQDLDALEVAEVIVRGGNKGAAAARDVKQKTVEDDLKALKAYVYAISALNMADAIAIILSAGLDLKRFTPRQKPVLEALMGPIPQEVLVRAKAVASRAAYEWQYSADGGKTWIAMGTTTGANHSVQGLTVGATYLFRFRSTVKKATSDWSQIVSFLVH